MSDPPACPGLAAQRSALLDGALRNADRERLLAHLVHCPDCRADVAELRRVRALLSSPATEPAAPPALTARLVGIPATAGGSGADRRPVLRHPPRRAALRHPARRVAVAGFTLAGLTVLGGAVGFAAAPADNRPLVDPSAAAAGELVAATAAMPLTLDAVQAVTSPDESALTAATAAGSPRGPAASSRPTGPVAARLVLERAASAAGRVSYRGRQDVWAVVSGQPYAGDVEVVAEPGEGRRATLVDPGGRAVRTWLNPALPSRLTNYDLVDLLADRWRLSAWTGDTMAGRSATVVEASGPDSGPAGGVAAVAVRWWVDDVTGLLLAQEVYDSSGSIALRARFTALQVGGEAPMAEHYSPRTVVPVATASLTTSSVVELRREGWICPDEVAGLPLLWVHTDGLATPQLVHLVYSDGVSTVSVVQQRGRMAEPAPDAVFDPAVNGWRRPGVPTAATWPSGEMVVTVAIAGPAQLLNRTAADLPRLPVVHRTTMGRVHAGWVRIVDALNG